MNLNIPGERLPVPSVHHVKRKVKYVLKMTNLKSPVGRGGGDNTDGNRVSVIKITGLAPTLTREGGLTNSGKDSCAYRPVPLVWLLLPKSPVALLVSPTPSSQVQLVPEVATLLPTPGVPHLFIPQHNLWSREPVHCW